MNAYQLHKPDGAPVDLWCCGNQDCQARHDLVYYAHQDDAEACCRPKVCIECGELTGSSALICEVCRLADDDRDLAQCDTIVVPEDGAMIFWDHIPGRDGYFASVADLLDTCRLHDVEPPEWAWACEPSRPEFDADQMVENAECDIRFGCTDYDDIDWNGLDEFRDACRKFTAANAGIVTWYCCYEAKVRVRQPEPRDAEERP